MAPKVDGVSLPDSGAQLAKNCDITSGAIRGINSVGPFVSMHTTDGAIKNTITTDDLVQITKPGTPVAISRSKICDPSQWLQVVAHEYISYIDTVTGIYTTSSSLRNIILPLQGYEHTETGMVLRYNLGANALDPLPAGNTFFHVGPRYQFRFLADSGHVYGGPDATLLVPEIPSVGDEEVPAMGVPLIDENNNIYATFQISDVTGPTWDETYVVGADDPDVYLTTSGEVSFKIDLNYTQANRKQYYFVSSGIDSDDREGPPSDLSDEPVLLKPGERITLSTPRPSDAEKMRIYRSATGGDDFLLLDEYESDQYTLSKDIVRTDSIPPYGNHPGTQADFISGAQIHPSHFGVSAHGKDLYISDPYRLHAWPEENTVPFADTITAYALTGNNILVFSGTNVHAVYGNNPEHMGKSLLSETTPLLNVMGLCRIGNTIFWPTHDGLAASSGGEPKIISNQHFTRQQWLEYSPEKMESSTADNSIYLVMGTPVTPSNLKVSVSALTAPILESGEQIENMRFDIEESTAAVSVYTAITGVDYKWRSKVYRYDQPTIFDSVQLDCDGTTTLTLYGDGDTYGPYTVSDDSPLTLDGLVHSRNWEFELEGSALIRGISIFDRKIPTIDKMITLNTQNVPTWERFYVKYPDRGRFAGGILNYQGSASVFIRFYSGDSLIATQEVSNGHPFALPRGLVRTDIWRIEIDTEQHIEELTLYDRQNVLLTDSVSPHNDGMPPWIHQKYQITDNKSLRTAKVMCDQNVNMRVYLDGAVTPTATYAVTSGDEIRLSDLPTSETIEFDFDGNDHAVVLAVVHTSQPYIIGDSYHVQNGPWRCHQLNFPEPGRPRVARIQGNNLTDATLYLYREGTIVQTETVTSGEIIVFDQDLENSHQWEVDILAPGQEIYELLVVAEQDQSVQFPDTPIGARPLDIIKPWLYTKYNFPDREEITSFRVQATSYPVYMRIYLDDATTPTKTISVTHGYEWVLRGMAHAQSMRFDFSTEDNDVREVYFYGRKPQVFPMSGYIVDSDAKPTRRRYMTFEDRNRPAVARIQASGYENSNVRLRFRSDETKVYDRAISDDKPFLLPRRFPKNTLWEYDVQVNNEHRAEIIQIKPKQVVGFRAQEVNRGTIPAWMESVYAMGGEKTITGVRVHADAYPVTMNLYADESEAATRILVVLDSDFVLLEDPLTANFIEYDFDGSDHTVNEVFITQPKSQNVGSGAVTISNDGVMGGNRFVFVDQGSFACGMVDADSYPVTLSVKVDGATTVDIAVADERAFRFPRTLEGTVWEIYLSGAGTIHQAILQPWVQRQVATTITAEYPASGFAPWLYTRWQAPKDRRITSIRALCDTAIPVSLYEDKATTASDTSTLQPQKTELIPNMGKVSQMDLHFDDRDDEVQRMWVFLEPEEVLSGPPITIKQRDSYRMMRYHFHDSGKIACIKISAKEYESMTLKVYNDGVLVFNQAVRDDTPIVLPKGLSSANRWEVDIQGVEGSEIETVMIYPLRREILRDQNRIRAVRRDGRVPEWYYTEYELHPSSKVRSAMCAGTSSRMNIYINGTSTFHGLSLQDGRERALSSPVEANHISFDFAGNDDSVRDAYVFIEDHVPIENTGVLLRHSLTHGWMNKLLEFGDLGAFSSGRLVATEYSQCKLTLESETGTVSVDVDDSNEFKIPELDPARQWWLKIDHEGMVRELHLFTTDRRKTSKRGIIWKRSDSPITWLDRRFYCTTPTSFTAARVLADAYPLRLDIRNGDDDIECIVTDDKPFRLPRVRPATEWAFDVITDTVVHEVAIVTSMEGLRRA